MNDDSVRLLMNQYLNKNLSSTLRGKSPATILTMLVLAALTYYFTPQEKTTDPHAAARGRYTGTCIKILDGDTIDVRADSGETFRIRLLGMDCMETFNQEKMAEQARRLHRSKQEVEQLGLRAKNRTRDLVLNKNISWLVPEGTPLFDPYDRMLAYIEVNSRDLGEQLLRDGLAELRRERHPREDTYRKIAAPLVR